MKFAAAASLVLALSACIYLPRTVEVYDSACHVGARQMTLEATQIGSLGHCQGQGCAQVLVAMGAVGAASAVVSGSIVVVGNIVYWFEKEGRCAAARATS